MRVKVKDITEGLHPSQAVVKIDTIDGMEELVVNRDAILHGQTIEIGYPIADQQGSYLIELPAETSTGTWRVWVKEDHVLDERMEAAE
jgi:hypothetical protein